MKIGLDLVNWKRVLSDSTIHLAGRSIKKVSITVDVSASDRQELSNAMQLLHIIQ